MPRWALWAISFMGFSVVARWAFTSGFVVITGNRLNWAEWWVQSRDYVEIAVALLIVAIITGYEGKAKAGLGHSVAYNVRTSIQGIYTILALGALAYQLLWLVIRTLVLSGQLPANRFVVGVSNEPSSVYENVLWSIHAGIVEEVILISLMFFLFKRSQLTIGGRPFWMTGWATAIVIAVRMSYHTYHGLMVIPMILTGWLLVRLYRGTGSVVPCIVVHITWDLSVSISDNWIVRASMILVLIAVSEVLTRGSDPFAAFGFPHLPFENKNWIGYYWARWRWDKAGKYPPVASQVKREREHVGLNNPDA